MKNVLVAGATGYAGYHVVGELKKRNYRVRALIRNEKQKEKFKDIDIDEFFIAQVAELETLQGIMNDIDWVFSSIGITRQKDGLTYDDVDYRGNLNLLKEAEQNNVELFAYISVFGADKFPELKIIQAKKKFVYALKNSSMKCSIIRPTGFFSDMRDFLNMATSKKIFLFGDGEYMISPISGKDLANVCIDSMEKGIEEINVGGPKVYSQNQIARIALNAFGLKGKIYHLPLWVRDTVLFLIRTFTTQKIYGPYEFFLTAMTTNAATDRYGSDLLEDFFETEARKILSNKD